MIDWIKDAYNDLIDWFLAILQAVFDFLTDIPLLILEKFLGAIASIIEAISVPEFIQNGLGSYLNGIDGGVLYFLAASGMNTAFAIVGSAVAFRLLRKLFTLGQW